MLVVWSTRKFSNIISMRDITCFTLLDIYHAYDIKNHSRTSNLYRTHTFPFLRSYIIEDGVGRNFSFRLTLSSSCRIHQFLRVLRLHSHVRKLLHSRLTFLPYLYLVLADFPWK